VGASQDALKKSYKKLTKVYHPDKIFHESPHMIEHYTHKFQLLQEAYEALRIVS
jgi:DnaJ-class molecular chaperone